MNINSDELHYLSPVLENIYYSYNPIRIFTLYDKNIIIDFITNLKKLKFKMCYVCYENKPLQKRSNCTHSFCAECNKKWNLVNPTCPICRS